MTKIDDGGPAFPLQGIGSAFAHGYAGMTLRDWFAGQAMAGWLAASPKVNGNNINGTKDNAEKLTEAAYIYADAMLEARKK